MIILKSILHHYNKVTKSYDTLHPETESAQITDWNQAVIGSLVSKVLPDVVSELTTDSVMGKLIKMLLNASGVKYLIADNGYICFGSFFGGLILQWMNVNITNKESIQITPPISFKNCYNGIVSDDGNSRLVYGFSPNNLTIYSEKREYTTICHVVMIGN